MLIFIFWSSKSRSGRGGTGEEVGKQFRSPAGDSPISRIDEDSRDPRPPPLYLVLRRSRIRRRRRMSPRALPLQFATCTSCCVARRRREGRFSSTGHASLSLALRCSVFPLLKFQVLTTLFVPKSFMLLLIFRDEIFGVTFQVKRLLSYSSLAN